MTGKRRTIKDDGPDAIDRHVGARLRALRNSLRLSQTKLGDALGVTFQQVQKYENSTNRLGASNLYKTAKFLGVGVDYFFEGLGEAESETGKAVVPEDDAMSSPDALRFARDVTGIPDATIRKIISQLVKATVNAESR